MKISKIKITDFHQFKDLTIELTYPIGHEKAGQPLSKVCFIGQSGTGKSTLLELIPKYLINYNTQLILKAGKVSINKRGLVSFKMGLDNEYSVDVNFSENKEDATKQSWNWFNIKENNAIAKFDEVYDFYKEKWTKELSTKLIYFPANLNFDAEEDVEEIFTDKAIIDFSKEKISVVWKLILERIRSYQEKELQIRQELSKTVEQASNNLNTIKNAVKKLEDWKKTEFNPIQDIADNCLDRLLEPFKLKVKTELDIRNKDDIGFIKIKDFADKEIPYGLWSTGTKQVILSALPLYLLKPRHTIILFDEPERSLYPDLQRFIIDYYSSLTEDCQFFYSTHSPIIASNFEPWEIVELKFNEEGNVYRELYYEGENHVDNYKWNPQYMRWGDILQRIFDMENDGSSIRKKKLDELATNNVKYKKLQKKGIAESEEAKNILQNIDRLSKELSHWD